MTTPVDIDKLKELLAKASAGPWQLYIPDDGSGAAVIKRHYEVEGGARVTDWPAVCNCGTLPKSANAALIVAIVNAAPALITKAERVDALTEVLERARLIVPEHCYNWHVAARNALSPKESE